VLTDQPLPPEYHLAHLALRSRPQQVMRVVLAELQKRSRGHAHAGLDVHYRLGYQLLAENPALFFSTICRPAAGLRLLPVDYQGTALRYTVGEDWARLARALLPYLEQLAASHGRLADAAGMADIAPVATESIIRQLTPADLPPPGTGPAAAFTGFTAREGWGAPEGPVPEAFLPPFHWGYAPATVLSVPSSGPHPARLVAEALTYSEQQVVTIELNGAPVLRHAFGRVNQKETLAASLSLRAGDNQLTLRYSECVRSGHDPRPLAVIFLSLQVRPA
jgi:hypothetical protein